MPHDRPRGSRALRVAIATSLRTAHVDLLDARLLEEGGSARNAVALLREAGAVVLRAVAASERGQVLRDEEVRRGDIPAANPRRRQLGRVLEATGRLGRSPEDRTDIRATIVDLAALVEALAASFEVDLDGDGPASSAGPLRPEPSATPPSARPRPEPPRPKPMRRKPTRRKPAVRRGATVVSDGAPTRTTGSQRATPSRRAASRDAAATDRRQPRRATTGGDRAETRNSPPDRRLPVQAPSAGSNPREATSTSFWSLMDRWKVGDEEALRLIGHRGGLTGKGARPRFRVKGDEALVFAALQEIDGVLIALAEDPARWLRAVVQDGSGRRAAPIDRIVRHGRAGADEVLRELAMLGFRRSL